MYVKVPVGKNDALIRDYQGYFVEGCSAEYIFNSLNRRLTDQTEQIVIPEEFTLSQNFPNPFNPATTIQFNIPDAGYYSLTVYSMVGEKVMELTKGYYSPGIYKVQFEGKNLPSGVYVYQLLGDNVKITKKMILMK